ncbi:MAG: PKD domain-containing protein [Thermoplasmata archaeon]
MIESLQNPLAVIFFIFIIAAMILCFVKTVSANDHSADTRIYTGYGNTYNTSAPSQPIEKSVEKSNLPDESTGLENSHTKSKAVSFWANNAATGAFYKISATLKKDGQYCHIYVEDGQGVSTATINSVISEFDTKIYPTTTTYFGSPPDTDNDPKIILLLLDIIDGSTPDDPLVAGYGNPDDLNPNAQYSNKHDMVYLDAPAIIYLSKNIWAGNLAHEFQHLIHYKYDEYEELFINEGLSDFASIVCGYKDSNGWDAFGHIQNFINSPDTSLVDFKYDDVKSYGASSLFMEYMSEHYGGGTFTKTLVSDPAHGVTSIDNTLKKLGYSQKFTDVLSDWTVANYIDNSDTSLNGGKYGYKNVNMAVPTSAVTVHSTYPVSKSAKVYYSAGDCIIFTGGKGGTLTIIFDGADSNTFSVAVVKKGSSATPSVEKMTLDASKKGQVSVGGFGSTYTAVTLIPASIVKSGSNPASYGYSATYSSTVIPPDGHTPPYFVESSSSYAIYDSNSDHKNDTIEFTFKIGINSTTPIDVRVMMTVKDNSYVTISSTNYTYSVSHGGANSYSVTWTCQKSDFYNILLLLYDNNTQAGTLRADNIKLELSDVSEDFKESFEQAVNTISDKSGDDLDDTFLFSYRVSTESTADVRVSVVLSVYLSSSLVDKVYDNFTVPQAAASNRNMSWTASQTGKYSFYAILIDDNNHTEAQKEYLNVQLIKFNRPPVVTTTPVTKATVGSKYAYSVDATDPDDDTLSFSLIESPASMSIDGDTGAIDWTPILEDIGINDITIDVSDGASSVQQFFKVTVANKSGGNGNNPPTISSFAPSDTTIYIAINEKVECIVNATDLDSADTLSFEWYLNDTRASTGANNYEYIASTDSADWYIVKCIISDGSANISKEWELHIQKPDTPVNTSAPPTPVISGVPNKISASEGIEFSAINSFDADGMIERYEWNFGDGTNGSGETVKHVYEKPGTYTVTLIVVDNNNETNRTSFTVSVIRGATGGDTNIYVYAAGIGAVCAVAGAIIFLYFKSSVFVMTTKGGTSMPPPPAWPQQTAPQMPSQPMPTAQQSQYNTPYPSQPYQTQPQQYQPQPMQSDQNPYPTSPYQYGTCPHCGGVVQIPSTGEYPMTIRCTSCGAESTIE